MPNIFKNSKTDNKSIVNSNRFNFLDDSEISKEKEKKSEKIIKKEKLKEEDNQLRRNYFKNNDNFEEEDSNSFKRVENKKNRKKFTDDNNYSNKNITEDSEQLKTNNEIKILEEDFPDLTERRIETDLPSNKIETDKSFKNLFNIKEESKENILIIEEEKIPDGCLCITYDKINRKINYKYGKMNYINKKKDLQQSMTQVANFYEKRKNDYINLWGQDMYNETFLFKNYDYDYFNKLDLEYDIEMEKLNDEIEQEDELESIDDYY